MKNISMHIRRTTFGFAAVLVTLFSPGMALAETTGEGSTTDTQSAQTTEPTTGPQQPTGADGKTFHYNSETGMWENDYYIWNPVTKQTTLKNQAYTYDPETDRWSTDAWKYDAPSQKYQKVETPVAAPATSSDGCGSCAGSGSYASSDFNSATAVAMANGLTSTAVSGDATLAFNTNGGSAASGNSTIMNNTLNLLQSSMSPGGVYVTDINNATPGDVMLDPAMLAMLQPASSTAGWDSSKINVNSDAQIHNTIALDASTGDATVIANTSAGDATSGSANAVANVVNLANSNVNAGGTFMGVINVHNLEGDILLPPSLMEKVLSSNAPKVTLDTSTIENGEMIANLLNNQSISNNVSTSAASGDASLAFNTGAGNATTGDAATNVTVLNLTGHEVIGSNALLVFINVLGKWTGVILDAPQGATAAALVDGNAATSCAACNGGGSTELNSTTNTGITNDIVVNAESGDATVAKNTSAGNATSGDANASVNLLNMVNSSLSLDNWFGILFINVLGTWNGSFGVDTPWGDVIASEANTSGSGAVSVTGPLTSNPSMKVFKLSTSADGQLSVNVVDEQSSTGDQGSVAAATTDSNGGGSSDVLAANSTKAVEHASGNWKFVTFGLFVSCCLVLIERMRSMRQHRLANAV
jgi:hypothetical protein